MSGVVEIAGFFASLALSIAAAAAIAGIATDLIIGIVRRNWRE